MMTPLERTLYLILMLGSLAVSMRIFSVRLTTIRRARGDTGQREPIRGGWQRMFVYIAGQWSGLQHVTAKDLAGLQHVLIFWGSICFLMSYLVVTIAGDAFGLGTGVRNSVIFKSVIGAGDVAGLLILVGLCWGLLRRSMVRPARLGPDFETVKFALIVSSALLLFTAYYALEAIRLNLGLVAWAGPISRIWADALNKLVGTPGDQKGLFTLFWWVQALLTAGFIVYVPLSSHQHPFFAPITIFQGPHQPRGRLSDVTLTESYNGVARPEDFQRRQLTEFYACTQCGRCQDACPATAAAKALSPKLIVQKLKDDMDADAGIRRFWRTGGVGTLNGQPSMAHGISDDELWSCTTCMACIEICPVFVSPLDKIIDVRRDRVMKQTRFFPEVTNLFNDTETFGDTFGKGKAFRQDWLMGKDIRVLQPSEKTETLFWVGCLGTFHDRAKMVATAFVDVLKKYSPDFAILGKAEFCCGDPVRRLGNEYLFQQLARRNIAVLNELTFDRIVTYCPHCYNTLKNEYPQLGGRFEVYHYTELLTQWVERDPMKISGRSDMRLVFQDPCYLARGNGLVSAPREIIQAITGAKPLEAQNAKERTFCCGGGGGQMWMRETGGDRINDRRVKQLAACNPDVIVTSCPYCMVMIEDGLKSVSGFEALKCRDIIQLVREGIA
jgi:Fe-S oxidoreductase